MKGKYGLAFLLLLLLYGTSSVAAPLTETIKKIQPSIVAVGVYNRMSSPSAVLLGTGFVVGNGLLVATNAHVVPKSLKFRGNEKLTVFIGQGKNTEVRDAEVLVRSDKYDLALLKFKGRPIPALKLATGDAEVGESIAFTGFPLGVAGQLFPITHRGIVSSISPLHLPIGNAKSLSSKQLAQARNRFNIYQLDALAYPGNSGSPVYRESSGEVIAIVNAVLLNNRGNKKAQAQYAATAFTFAVPVRYLRQLIAVHTK